MTWNNCQLKKELRPLLLPWIGAVAAGSLIALRPLVESEGLESLLTGIVAYGFFGGLALVAAMGFGQELQERTLYLLLTQPRRRSSLWSQKMMIVTAAVIAATLVEVGLLTGISNWYSGDQLRDAVKASFSKEDLFMAACFLLAAVCSSGFWTLVAGSVVGGLVFTVASQFLSAVSVALVWAKLNGYDQPFQEQHTFVLLAAMTVIYSGVFLWLSWRKFVRLEVRTRSPGEGLAASIASGWKLPWTDLLVCRPKGPVLNVVRKELRLQKSVAQLAAVFVLCWICVVLLQWLRPGQDITYLFDFMTCLYAPLSSLLAGCIPLGEEKVLGLTASQLALPFSSRLQWFLKLVASAATAAILSLGLPVLLFYITSLIGTIHSSGLMNSNAEGMLSISCISGLMFLLGFWAISLTPNTVRAALVAIASLIILPAIAIIGPYLAMLLTEMWTGGQQHGIREALVKETIGAVVILILGQSFFQFPKSEERQSKLFFYSFILGGVVLFVSFWATCFG